MGFEIFFTMKFNRLYIVRWTVIIVLLATGACESVESEFQKCQQDGLCGSILEIKRIASEFPNSPNHPTWQSEASFANVKLGPQLITNPQWPNPAVKSVLVCALRSNSEIAVLLEWDDNSNELESSYSDEYTDKAAVMFPLRTEMPPITMGAEGHPVNIWQWKASLEKPLKKTLFPGNTPLSKTVVQDDKVNPDIKKSPVEDLNAEGFSTLTYQVRQNVFGKGIWKNKKWRVMFKRNLKNEDLKDVQFFGSTPMAIAIWNGANKERNGQKGVANWVLLKF